MLPLDPDPQFRLTAPDDIRFALFELNHPESRIVVRNTADQETAVEVMAVDADVRRIYWRPRDHSGTVLASQGVKSMLAGSLFRFDAHGYGGVVVQFHVPRPVIVYSDDGEPALSSPFPDELVRIQRRRSFRATLRGGLRAVARWRRDQAAQPVSMAIRDVSIDGLGLRAELPVDALPAVGATLHAVSLDFGEYGSLTADLTVRNTYALGSQDEPQAAAAEAAAEPVLSHVGASFMVMEAKHQSWLQQMVWRMERARP